VYYKKKDPAKTKAHEGILAIAPLRAKIVLGIVADLPRGTFGRKGQFD
jgi:hypothetical protein